LLRPSLLSASVASLGLLGLLMACGDDPAPGADGATGSSHAGGGTSGLLPTPSTSGGVGSSSGSTFAAAVKAGKATYYDYLGADAVACSFDITSDTDVTALPDDDFAGSAACGACVTVSGPKGKVTVRVVDRCADCEPGHIDLSAQAFAKIADPTLGHVPVTYQVVECAAAGPMSYRVKEGSSEYWTAIQIRNHRLPVAKVEVMKDGAFTDMPRETYNYFVLSSGVGKQPAGIQLRLTAFDGQVVTDTVPGPQAGQTFTGVSQFK
jgi:expansin (peptidoglycan-binding protein)